MLDLDDDPGRRFDVCAVNLAVGRDVRNLPAGLRKKTLPRPMPLGLVLPPWIAVAPAGMGPVVQDARPALGDHRGTAGGAHSATAHEGLAPVAVYKGVLHDATLALIGPPRRSGLRRGPTTRGKRPRSERHRHGRRSSYRPSGMHRRTDP